MSSSRSAILEAVLVGKVREHPGEGPNGPFQQPWRSAYIKEPVDRPVWIRKLGLEGDQVADTRVHGGPEQSVLAYPACHYGHWRSELGIEDMGPGGFGENLCVTELDETRVCIGDQYQVGGAVLQVSLPRLPCASINRRWRIPHLAQKVGRLSRTGWYFRVLSEGEVSAGDRLQRLARPLPEWTVAKVLQLRLNNDQDSLEPAGRLAACELLAAHWREHFAARVTRRSNQP